jgi:hypothetical protein
MPVDRLWFFCDDVAHPQQPVPDMHVRPMLLPALITIGLAVGPITVHATDWRDYARVAMTPEFAWAETEAASTPDARDGMASALTDTVRAEFQSALARQVVEVQFSQSRGNDLAASNVASLSLMDEAAPGLNRQIAGLQLAHEFDGGARVGAGVVVAEQQFASFGFGSEQIERADRLQWVVGGESSTAAGVRLNYVQPLGSLWSVQAALQSKIDMQPFQSYRGVFSDPGDFDIPAEAEVSARVALSPVLGVTFGSQRVMYSELKAFSSYALPERFLSLLGDGTSPVFAWRDLTVYNVALDYAIGKSSRLDFRYSTQQQPEPSSTLLFEALREEFTDRNIAIGLTHRFDRAGELRLAASHAPVEYFLGTTSALGRGDAGGDQFEFEARWRVDF